jgi:hypothetical protein
VFGHWSTDSGGLPCFVLTPPPYCDRSLIWHQVGADLLAGTTDAGGVTTLWASARGYQSRRGDWQAGSITPRTHVPIEVRWGIGYAEWLYDEGSLRVRRRVSAVPGSIPILYVEVELEGDVPDGTVVSEIWPVRPYPVIFGGLATPLTSPPRTHSRMQRVVWYVMTSVSGLMRLGTEVVRRLWQRRLRVEVAASPDRRVVTARLRWAWPRMAQQHRRRAWFDTEPDPVWVHLDAGVAVAAGVGGDEQIRFDAAPVRGRASFYVGAGEGGPPGRRAGPSPGLEIALAQHADPDGVLSREAVWHAAYLRGAQVYDTGFDTKFVPQGSAYGFVQGLHGAPRDYAISAVALALVDPAAAKAAIRLMLRMTTPDGSMHYAHTGAGRCTSAGIHKFPSDLPLFLLWAVSEYVWASGDAEFLEEIVPFWCRDQRASTVAERVVLAARWLSESLGTGEHGLLRVGSGDWSDPISAMVRNRAAFHARGESVFNSAFAVYVLPRAAALIEASHPNAATDMTVAAEVIRSAVAKTWVGGWFLRGWDGAGRPIGDTHLFLDAQAWCLVAGVGTAGQRARLREEIRLRCVEPSPIGATILDRPHPNRFGMLPAGQDCNGGVWAAINAILAWGLAADGDTAAAWDCLRRQSLASHARAYPHVWYGIWSGPDAYNSHFSDRPGETFVQPATPMREFPVMNSNQHAGPLLALFRTLGVETEPGGVAVRARASYAAPWHLRTARVEIDCDASGNVAMRRRS